MISLCWWSRRADFTILCISACCHPFPVSQCTRLWPFHSLRGKFLHPCSSKASARQKRLLPLLARSLRIRRHKRTALHQGGDKPRPAECPKFKVSGQRCVALVKRFWSIRILAESMNDVVEASWESSKVNCLPIRCIVRYAFRRGAWV